MVKPQSWEDVKLVDLHTHLLGNGDSEFWMRLLFSRSALDQSWSHILVWKTNPPPDDRSPDAVPPLAGEFLFPERVYEDLEEALGNRCVPEWALNPENGKVKCRIGGVSMELDHEQWNAKVHEYFPASRRATETGVQTTSPADTSHTTADAMATAEDAAVPPQPAATAGAADAEVPPATMFLLPPEHFQADIVIRQDHLIEALGLTLADPLAFSRMRERLMLKREYFKECIIWNARRQCLEICCGVPRNKLIDHRNGLTKTDRTVFDAHMKNAFSMLNPDGTKPRVVDMHTFHNSFTPEFYPRRYVLKDSLYEQRLDVLAILLRHSLKRYSATFPRTSYVEFSLGAGDCARPHILDVLAAFHPFARDTSFFFTELVWRDDKKRRRPTTSSEDARDMPHAASQQSAADPIADVDSEVEEAEAAEVLQEVLYQDSFQASTHASLSMEASDDDDELGSPERHQSQTSDKPPTPNFRYHYLLDDRDRFPTFYLLAGIARNVNDKYKEWMWDNPMQAVAEFERQIARAEDRDRDMFRGQEEQLVKLRKAAKAFPRLFRSLVVGIDVMSDELTQPFCPLVVPAFARLMRTCRRLNPQFGVRIHGAENVPVCEAKTNAFRCVAAHVFIVLRGLKVVLHTLKSITRDDDTHLNFIRVGHGVQFRRIFCLTKDAEKVAKHRKSWLLIQYVHDNEAWLKNHVVFEVNPTSNDYLVERQEASTFWWFVSRGFLAVLATDNDGIWPIDRCRQGHYDHFSLAAEYCNAAADQTDAFWRVAKSKAYDFVIPKHRAVKERVHRVKERVHETAVRFQLALSAWAARAFAFMDIVGGEQAQARLALRTVFQFAEKHKQQLFAGLLDRQQVQQVLKEDMRVFYKKSQAAVKAFNNQNWRQLRHAMAAFRSHAGRQPRNRVIRRSFQHALPGLWPNRMVGEWPQDRFFRVCCEYFAYSGQIDLGREGRRPPRVFLLINKGKGKINEKEGEINEKEGEIRQFFELDCIEELGDVWRQLVTLRDFRILHVARPPNDLMHSRYKLKDNDRRIFSHVFLNTFPTLQQVQSVLDRIVPEEGHGRDELTPISSWNINLFPRRFRNLPSKAAEPKGRRGAVRIATVFNDSSDIRTSDGSGCQEAAVCYPFCCDGDALQASIRCFVTFPGMQFLIGVQEGDEEGEEGEWGDGEGEDEGEGDEGNEEGNGEGDGEGGEGIDWDDDDDESEKDSNEVFADEDSHRRERLRKRRSDELVTASKQPKKRDD